MKVLFICTANVCRSPLAEGYLKRLLKENPLQDVQVESAGVIALHGSSAYECAIEVARQTGFDLKGHTARQITAEMAEATDQILCMETWHASRIHRQRSREERSHLQTQLGRPEADSVSEGVSNNLLRAATGKHLLCK